MTLVMFETFLFCVLIVNARGYAVSNCTDLQNKLNYTGYNFLMNNITCTGNFKPLNTTLSGVLDGRGHTINGILISTKGFHFPSF